MPSGLFYSCLFPGRNDKEKRDNRLIRQFLQETVLRFSVAVYKKPNQKRTNPAGRSPITTIFEKCQVFSVIVLKFQKNFSGKALFYLKKKAECDKIEGEEKASFPPYPKPRRKAVAKRRYPKAKGNPAGQIIRRSDAFRCPRPRTNQTKILRGNT